jgi:hypothetical protein
MPELTELEDKIRLEKDFVECESVLQSLNGDNPLFGKSWEIATSLVTEIKPIPWSVWRIASFVFGSYGRINTPPEGMFLGYQNFLSTLNKDPEFGTEFKELNPLEIPSKISVDVVISTLIMYSVCRKLSHLPLKRIWSTMLDDALIRARIGGSLASYSSNFGVGRGLLAGFSGRMGIVLLLATGNHQKAARTLQLLADGQTLRTVGIDIFGVDPLHVSAVTLLSAGFGLDAACGIVAFNTPSLVATNTIQEEWQSAFSIVEHSRLGQFGKISEKNWNTFGLTSHEKKDEFRRQVNNYSRKGHLFEWLL